MNICPKNVFDVLFVSEIITKERLTGYMFLLKIKNFNWSCFWNVEDVKKRGSHKRESMQKESTLALKPRADVTRSPKQGYQWPHEKD